MDSNNSFPILQLLYLSILVLHDSYSSSYWPLVFTIETLGYQRMNSQPIASPQSFNLIRILILPCLAFTLFISSSNPVLAPQISFFLLTTLLLKDHSDSLALQAISSILDPGSNKSYQSYTSTHHFKFSAQPRTSPKISTIPRRQN